MSKFCPYCDSENEDLAQECVVCGMPLEGVEIIVAEDEQPTGDTVPLVTWRIRCPVDGKLIVVEGPEDRCKSCPYEDDDYDVDFTACKAVRVETIIAIPPEGSPCEPLLALESIEYDFDDNWVAHPQNGVITKNYAPIIIQNGGIIGRTDGDIAPELFSKRDCVAGTHCRIPLSNNVWYVENLSKMNPTCVDEVKISQGIRNKLHDKALLQIADMLFLVTIRGQDSAESTMLEDVDHEDNGEIKSNDALNSEHVGEKQAGKEEKEEWVIICPCCGWRYRVEGKDSRILECIHCDEWDKEEIENERPVKIHVNR